MEKYEVLISDPGRQDLEDIYDFVLNESQTNEIAERFVRKIEALVLSLSEMPQRGMPRRTGRYAGKGYRQLFISHYVAIYRIDEINKQVIVLAVRSTRAGH